MSKEELINKAVEEIESYFMERWAYIDYKTYEDIYNILNELCTKIEILSYDDNRIRDE